MRNWQRNPPFPQLKLDRNKQRSQILYMRTIVYPLRLPAWLYARVRAEARKRHKKISELFREVIHYGLPRLPPLPDTSEAVADTWEKLGPAPS